MMKQKKKKKGLGNVNGYALLYGRSSKAIRIVNGERVGMVDDKKRNSKAVRIVNGGGIGNMRIRSTSNTSRAAKPALTKYKISDEAKKKLDRLQDPLEMMNRTARAQKYEATKSAERYEYGLSDW